MKKALVAVVKHQSRAMLIATDSRVLDDNTHFPELDYFCVPLPDEGELPPPGIYSVDFEERPYGKFANVSYWPVLLGELPGLCTLSPE